MKNRCVALTTAGVLGLVSLLGPAFTAPATAAEATCAGETATRTDADAYTDEDGTVWVDGTAGDDVIAITVEVDVVDGKGGDDLICQTTPGIPVAIIGGPGSDTIHGPPGPTTYWLGADEGLGEPASGDVDVIHDAGGTDELRVLGATGPVNFDVPTTHLSGGNLDLTWHDPIEQFYSDGDETVFTGGQRAEKFDGDGTGSVVRSGGGADVIEVKKPADVETGDGDDQVTVWASVVPGASRVVSGAGADRISVDGAGPDDVDAGDGDDIVRLYKDANADAEVALGAGHDWLYFVGKTTASGGSGNDTFFPRAASGTGLRADISGGPGHNRINFSGVSIGVHSYLDQGFSRWGTNVMGTRYFDRLTGSKYGDVLAGTVGANRISGGGGNDRLVGRAGNDVLRGDSGRDRAEGGPGNDTCTAETRISC